MARRINKKNVRIEPRRIVGLLKKGSMSVRQLTHALGLHISERTKVQVQLTALKSDGVVVRMRGGQYGLPQTEKLVIGKLSQKQPGFAFLICDEEGQEDLYLPASNLKDAMAGDEVEARVYSDDRFGGRKRAQVTKVLKRCRNQIVGTLKKQQGYALIRPDGLPFVREFFVGKGQVKKAEDNDKVVAKVITWPDQFEQGKAAVTEVLGKADDPGVDITSIVKRFELPEGFSLEALKEAKQIGHEPDADIYEDRLDLRDLQLVTIDGADARDFDDAVSCEALPNKRWKLGVHIADVSHYLQAGTTLDLEARERGTSVYLPDRVLHMLPEELSCGVCSLVPDKDRFTLSAFMVINREGVTEETSFHRTVIHSDARLTYEWVEDILTAKSSDNPAWSHKDLLLQLFAVSKALRVNRNKRGNLDFDLPDPQVVLDDTGNVATIEKRRQLESHRLIEDCMIAANEAVATYLLRVDMPSLYRVHEPPSGEKMENFKMFLDAYGYTFKMGKLKEASQTFQKLLHSWQGKPEERVMNQALLRSMKLAVYKEKNGGHFGLGSPCYTHFTSPIRRYPDLIVHRMLAEQLEKNKLSAGRRKELEHHMPDWGRHLSERERRAEKAERMAVRVKQVAFMKSKLGDVFEGIVTSVKSFGFFVELEEHFVEGLVLLSDMRDDYYQFEKDQQYLLGVNSGREFRNGTKVTIRVADVDEDEIRVYFYLIDNNKSQLKRPNNPPRMKQARRRKKR